MGRASDALGTSQLIRNEITYFFGKISIKYRKKMERSATRRRWERDRRELMRVGLDSVEETERI